MDFENSKLDLDYIKGIIQDILNKAHTIPEKRVLVVRPNEQVPREISFACAICGDSHNRHNQKRAHLYLRNFYIKCYNDDSCSMSFIKYCKQFGVDIDIEKRMQIYNYLDQNFKLSPKDDFAVTNMDKLLDLENFFTELNKNKTYLKNVGPIVNGTVFHKYLADRKIFNYENIRCGYYQITDRWLEPVIIILNRTADKLLGMQLRNLKEEKIKRIYKFISFQELYNMMHPDAQLDEIEAISYNKMSAIFNFLNVDYERPVYVFEGYLDSVFFPNSIALVGLDTDISMFSDERVEMKFVLDNDESGQRKAKQMIDENHSVFLWKRLINDLSKGKGTKYKHMLQECKDINKLVEFFGDYNLYYNLKLEKYFAVDQFDLIDM
jgi:hypothetical protein